MLVDSEVECIDAKDKKKIFVNKSWLLDGKIGHFEQKETV